MTLQLVVMGIGAAAEMIAWRLIVEGRANVWRAMTTTFVAMGVAAVLVRRPIWANGVTASAAAIWGVSAGVLLYVATRAFVALAWAWPPFRRGTAAAYGLAGDVSVAAAAMLAGVMVLGEELFWRGLVQARLSQSGMLVGATMTWVAFVAVNAVSAGLAIIAAAVVGGAVWAALAWWTGGILASLLCHLVWTVSMIVRPPRERGAPRA